jgi:acetylornithine deacetylase
VTVTENDILSLIDDDGTVRLTQELVRIPSENPPGNELPVVKYLEDWLKERSLEYQMVSAEPGRPNLIVSYGPDGGPVFMLNGHTNVVPPGDGWTVAPYGGDLVDGKIYGRGSSDMKGGISAILHSLDAIRRSGARLKGKLLAVLNVDEETGGKAGAGYLASNGIVRAGSCLVCEPSSLMMCTAEGGLIWITLTFRGKAVHSVLCTNGINAVEKAIGVVHALLPLKREIMSHVGQRGKPTVFTINMFHGGSKVNQVPGQCEVSIDVRIPPGVDIRPLDVVDRIEVTLREMQETDPDLDVTLSHRDPVFPFEIPPESRVISVLQQAIEDVTGKPAEHWHPKQLLKNDDSDLYSWWTKAHIPGIYFGPGAIEQSHNSDEHVEIEEIKKATRIFTLVALRTLGWD